MLLALLLLPPEYWGHGSKPAHFLLSSHLPHEYRTLSVYLPPLAGLGRALDHFLIIQWLSHPLHLYADCHTIMMSNGIRISWTF